MLKNTSGSPVKGDSFYDRVEEQRRIWTRLETDNLLLLAPRRVGKTSLLYRLLDTAESHDFSAIYLSVSDKSTELAFVEALYTAVAKQDWGWRVIKGLRKGLVGKLLKRVKKVQLPAGAGLEFSDAAAEQWAMLAESLTHALSKREGGWLIMIDELPLFVMSLIRDDPTLTRARTFLNWFRELRIGLEASDNIRWLLCGSIGLDTVAARHGLGDTINDLYLVDLGAFEPHIADCFLDALGRDYQLPLGAEVRARILDRIGWPIPFYLQVVFAMIRERHAADTTDRGRGVRPTPVTPAQKLLRLLAAALERRAGTARRTARLPAAHRRCQGTGRCHRFGPGA